MWCCAEYIRWGDDGRQETGDRRPSYGVDAPYELQRALYSSRPGQHGVHCATSTTGRAACPGCAHAATARLRGNVSEPFLLNLLPMREDERG